jgi:hypothetical protein
MRGSLEWMSYGIGLVIPRFANLFMSSRSVYRRAVATITVDSPVRRKPRPSINTVSHRQKAARISHPGRSRRGQLRRAAAGRFSAGDATTRSEPTSLTRLFLHALQNALPAFGGRLLEAESRAAKQSVPTPLRSLAIANWESRQFRPNSQKLSDQRRSSWSLVIRGVDFIPM